LRFFTARRGRFKDVLLLVEQGLTVEYKEWILSSVDIAKQEHVFFYEGNIENEMDADRVDLQRAAICFVVPDADLARGMSKIEKDNHDLINIMKAMSVQKFAENVRLRLALLSSSKRQAEAFGIDGNAILSLGETSAALVALVSECGAV